MYAIRSYYETIEGYIRTGYQYTDIKNNAAYTDLALGGKLHIETSPWQHMNTGISLYTTNVLGSNNGGNGIPFFNLHNNSYAIIGEAYLKGEWDQTMLKIGRQEIDTPFADTDDIGMIPNTFEAAILVNKSVPDTTIFLAQLQTMAGVDAESPSSFTKLNGTNGVHTVGISYEGIEDISISGWYYKLDDFKIDQIRITSYNVCYTKLLRKGIGRAVAEKFAQNGADIAFTYNSNKESVITSYSIHYTKLYELYR